MEKCIIVAVSDNTPKVKACISNPHADLPLNEFGKLDVLVNNAGIMDDMSPIADATDEMYERVMERGESSGN